MKDIEQRAAAKAFAEYWEGKGDEISDTQTFWNTFFQKVLGITDVEDELDYEKRVTIDGTKKRIDGYVLGTRVLIEQKSIDKDLTKPEFQSGGIKLTPYEQAKRYSNNLPTDEYPKWIITCNFREFHIYNMNKPGEAPTKILLSELPKKYSEFGFLIDSTKAEIKHETEISIQAGELVGKIYDAFLDQYPDKEDPHALHSLNVLCVRLVFCLYAEDAGLFGRRDMFHDYMGSFRLENMRMGLIELFKTLDTEEDKRDPFGEQKLNEFPYVNGGLFSKNEDILIPPITQEIADLLLEKASMSFDWSEISPTIFGAVFESTLNPETRRSGGMHYTSIENIHKVIDPLFLNDLKEELEEIKAIQIVRTKRNKLQVFQEKIASLTWLDPAAGSGNFLTETYLCIRRLENQIIAELISMEKGQTAGQIMVAVGGNNPIKVSINQFYGIEINDFAVTVAATALWIAESQMLKETEDIVSQHIDFFPLKSYVNMVEGNAVTTAWDVILPSKRFDFIMGNPPFVGGMQMSREQKDEIRNLFESVKGVGEMDYVCAWYKRASDFMRDSDTRVAFVSTNSICQGESVITFWRHMMSTYNIKIDYAFTTFVWNSEAKEKAKVHCVIVGFSDAAKHNDINKRIYDETGAFKSCSNINPYLIDAPDYFIDYRSTPLCDVPAMRFGSMPRDGGGFVLTPDERKEFISNNPISEKWIKPYIGATEFLNNKERYCLWLVDAEPGEISKCNLVLDRVEHVRQFRANSKAAGTRKFAETPTLFCQIAQPDTNYIVVPKTSSGKRRYLPLGFLDKDIIASDLVFLIPDADIYDFGVLMSNVHNAWMRVVAGRLKSDYRYSKDIVYNTFPWPNANEVQRRQIEQTAQAILEARNNHKESTLAQLYDAKLMPKDLLDAHRANDRAVWEAYGKKWDITSESDCVAYLMKEYQRLTSE